MGLEMWTIEDSEHVYNKRRGGSMEIS